MIHWSIDALIDEKENQEIDAQPDPDANAAKFWQKRPAILSTIGKSSLELFYGRTVTNTRAADSCESQQLADASDDQSHIDETPIANAADNNSFRSIGRAKFNELYNKLSLSRNKLSLIREKRMEAKQIIEETRERLTASRNTLLNNEMEDSGGDGGGDGGGDESPAPNEEKEEKPLTQLGANIVVCDNLEMDTSLDELSHVSRSTENISGDDSLTMSMPSIDDGTTTTQHLNVSRKIAIGEIGRSTSDNPRLRHKFHLGDIGRSFSESQDDEAIMIGERHISAPTSSIAIENNNHRMHAGFLERRAYSVSPTQSNVRRGILFRDQSLNERSSSRASGSAPLHRDSSLQSDSSRCSSVESLLDARRPDSEAILRHLGFGPVQQEDLLSKIPKRYVAMRICYSIHLLQHIFYFSQISETISSARHRYRSIYAATADC